MLICVVDSVQSFGGFKLLIYIYICTSESEIGHNVLKRILLSPFKGGDT